MNLIHLKYAAEIGKTNSLSKAAENLYIDQSNLSRAIKELESSLGITIFTRSQKGMKPTADGETFLQYAKEILVRIDEVEAMFKGEIASKKKFSISVPRASYIADAFAKFSLKTGDEPIELFYKETNALRAIKNILEADYALGIIRYAQDYDKHFKAMLKKKGLNGETVTEFNYVLVMSKKHPLASHDNIRYSDLRKYTEIAHADPYVPSLSLAAVSKKELPGDIQRRIFVFERASQFELLSENHNTFMWVSPIPQKLLSRYELVEQKCCDNARIYKDVLIYRKDYSLTELDKLFIAELHSAKKRYL